MDISKEIEKIRDGLVRAGLRGVWDPQANGVLDILTALNKRVDENYAMNEGHKTDYAYLLKFIKDLDKQFGAADKIQMDYGQRLYKAEKILLNHCRDAPIKDPELKPCKRCGVSALYTMGAERHSIVCQRAWSCGYAISADAGRTDKDKLYHIWNNQP